MGASFSRDLDLHRALVSEARVYLSSVCRSVLEGSEDMDDPYSLLLLAGCFVCLSFFCFDAC